MDQKTIKLISERLAKSSPIELVLQYNNNKASFRNMPLEDTYSTVIMSVMAESSERSYLVKKVNSHRSAIKRKADRMNNKPTSYLVSIPDDYNGELVKEWILSPENQDFLFFFTYPYLDCLPEKKRKVLLTQDLTSVFFQSIKQYDYSLTNYYTYFTSTMSSYPLFGISKSKKHEVTIPSKDQDTDISYYSGFSNNSYFELTRTEKSRPLDSNHKKLYEFILKKFVEKKYYNQSNEPPGIEPNDLFVWEHEMISHMGMETYNYQQASKQIADMIYDISDMRLDLMSDPDTRIITGRTGLINPFYNRESFTNEDGKITYGYHFENIESGLFNSYIQENLLRTLTDDVKMIGDNANLLMPFFVSERILLYKSGSKDPYVVYDAFLFLSKLRLYVKRIDKLLEHLIPILDEYCKQGIQIRSYRVLDKNIEIEYIPLTKAEYEATFLSLSI